MLCRKLFPAITTIFALVGQQPASAQEYYVLGRGTYSCGDFLQTSENERKARPQDAKTNHVYTQAYLVY
jgi:hypothetical protein